MAFSYRRERNIFRRSQLSPEKNHKKLKTCVYLMKNICRMSVWNIFSSTLTSFSRGRRRTQVKIQFTIWTFSPSDTHLPQFTSWQLQFYCKHSDKRCTIIFFYKKNVMEIFQYSGLFCCFDRKNSNSSWKRSVIPNVWLWL